MRKDWRDAPNAVDVFSRYCAPTALASLMDCSRVEAAELLLAAPRVASDKRGCVKSSEWQRWLVTDLDAVKLTVERPDAVERWTAALDAFAEREDAYYNGRTRRPPRLSYKNAAQYTVAQFLRLHPRGVIVLGVESHTLLARDGRVVADTQASKSKRARVRYAYLVPGA
jgi:hypothetical protein